MLGMFISFFVRIPRKNLISAGDPAAELLEQFHKIMYISMVRVRSAINVGDLSLLQIPRFLVVKLLIYL